METLISPGVLARENDNSQITSQPVEAGAAILGPTVKGKVGIPKLVTTYSEYLANFGSSFESGSDSYTFLTSISAYNYFQNGGKSLLVTRIQSASWAPATSSATGTYLHANSSSFTLETLSDGQILNSTSTVGSDGSLPSGSTNNIRWEITSPNTSSGTFTVLIRQGNDKTNSKTILETWSNISLDPKQPNYIERIIGNQTQVVRGSGTNLYVQTTGSYPNASNYVRVKEVLYKTPDYFNNSGVAKDQYTSSIPLATSGTFGGASGDITKSGTKFYENISSTDSQGLIGNNYTDSLNLLANKDDYRYNIISAPGLVYSAANHSTAINTMITNTANRGDAIAIVDLELYGSTPTAAVSTAVSIDSSYAAAYWPWCQLKDPDTGNLVWVPASTLLPGVYAYNDKIGETWFAPAGISKGGLNIVSQAERKLPQADRDTLYNGKVNPISTFPGKGICAFGQKTLQAKPSATDRINVRRLLIELKTFISGIADNLVFTNNTNVTRNQFLSQVNPYMESVKQRQGLYAYKVTMDDSNNTSSVIDRNQMVGLIQIQPSRTSEFIILDFSISPTGATFPA